VRLICPHEPALLKRLDGRTVLVRVDDVAGIAQAAGDARSRNQLERVLATASLPLSQIPLAESWRAIPIDLMVPALGAMGDVLAIIPALRRLNLRVVLPAAGEHFAGAKVLASLGVPVAITLSQSRDWDALADLMSYALVSPVQHAPIEPFATLAAGFRADGRCEDWGRAEYDDPSRYLHLDREGRIALSAAELAAGDFFGDFAMLDSIALHQAVRERGEAWRELFAQNHFCARCRAFRLCRGRLRDGLAEPDGCDDFFDEAIEVLTRRAARTERRAP
jgi:hypothetical protein